MENYTLKKKLKKTFRVIYSLRLRVYVWPVRIMECQCQGLSNASLSAEIFLKSAKKNTPKEKLLPGSMFMGW